MKAEGKVVAGCDLPEQGSLQSYANSHVPPMFLCKFYVLIDLFSTNICLRISLTNNSE
jgi:hypothetical protein